MEFGSLTIDTYAREDHIDAIRKSAEELAKALEYYQQLWGDSASGKNYRLVEVSDKLALQPGTLGTIFVTHKEVAQRTPPVLALARRAAYQWWMETVGVQSAGDLWLADGMAYYSAALYLGATAGPEALKEEMDNLAVLALKFENRSAIRAAISLGYGSDAFASVVAGKGAYVLIMLQGLMGNTKFADLLQQYVKKTDGAVGSTTLFQQLAEGTFGKELAWFFAEWLDTTGVPNLQVDYVTYKTRDGFRISGAVKQDRDLFRMPLEIEAIGDGTRERTTIDLSGKATAFDINIFSWPKKVIIDPDNKLLRDSDELRFKVQLTLGSDLRQKGDLIDSIRAYEQAIKNNPLKSIAHFRLAEVFFEQMNLQTAANTFRDALNGDRNPKWIEVWCYVYLGKIFDILGQRQRALAEYNKALNTKDNTDGALEEAKKWLAAPYTREPGSAGKNIQ
jgi:tetratricopeptide (TPR) repeat protein